MTTPWRIRPYRPGDETALTALWTASFGRPLTEEAWRWKLKSRPTPVENVGIAVDDSDRPIFQFAGVPSPARVLGMQRHVMVGGDVMTASAFRRRGVFTATAKHLFDTWREAGIALCYGLGNDHAWGSRAKELGFERGLTLQSLIRPLRLERVLARRTGVRSLARLESLGRLWNRYWDRDASRDSTIAIRALAAPTHELDRIWDNGAQHLGTSLVRDLAWVRWRYGGHPNRVYHLTLAERRGAPVGYGVYRAMRDDGRTTVSIPEVFAPGDDAAMAALVRDFVRRALDENADSIATLAVPGSPVHRAFRKAGFVFSRGGWPIDVLRLDPTIQRVRLLDPGSWWLTGADFDVI
jgi:hypothetical protein